MALKNHDKRSISPVAGNRDRGYRSPVATNSATGRRNPLRNWRNSAQITTVGVFFRLQSSVMAAVCGQASAWSGSNFPGIPTSHTAATQSRRKDRGSSKLKLEITMTTLSPSRIRALAHRRMALTALRADSSLKTRLARYNIHMQKAHALEAQGRAV